MALSRMLSWMVTSQVTGSHFEVLTTCKINRYKPVISSSCQIYKSVFYLDQPYGMHIAIVAIFYM